MATILTKKKDTSGAPSAGDLTNSTGGAELAVNTADKRLYTKDSGGNVVEVGINPTSITTGTLNTSGAVVFNDAGADVDFRVEGDTDANLLFVDASADNVGIGNNAPAAKLHITDSGNTTADGIRLTLGSEARDHNIYSAISTGRDLTIAPWRGLSINTGSGFTEGVLALNGYEYTTFGTGSSYTERMRIDSSGNVGIGVTPSAWGSGTLALDIGSGSALWNPGSGTQTQLLNNSYNNGTNFIYKNSSSAARYRMTGSQHEWHTAPSGTAGNAITFTQAMTLDASGNLLVGMTSGSRKVNVSFTAASGGMYLETSNNDANFMQFVRSATTNLLHRIIGSTYQINNDINGVSLVYGGTSWGAVSDERNKDIIEPIANAVEKVSSLRAVIGKYKTDAEDTRRAFLIAQDVQAVLPEAVYTTSEEDDTLNLAYTDTIPLLVAAIKELKTELDTVKAELATLKG